MNLGKIKLSLLILFLSFSQASFAAGEGEGSNYVIYSILAIALFLFFLMLLQVSDNLMAIEAKQSGADQSGNRFSIFPSWKEFFSNKLPEYVEDQPVTVLKKGHDILLEGGAEKTSINGLAKGNTFAVMPPNFIGISPIPKVTVEVGDTVKAGDTLFFDKKQPEIKHAAPVSGEVVAVNRGEKRSIAEVVILADEVIQHRKFDAFDLESGSREDLVAYLIESGAWPLLRQRPYDVIPKSTDIPRDIFISTFDTAPLAPDLNYVVEGRGEDFQKGLEVLAKLTEGAVHLGLSANEDTPPSSIFTEATGVEKRWFTGKHPAGNVGVQIHHSKPIGNGDKVWVLSVQDVLTFGALFNKGIFDARRKVAVTGAKVNEPVYVDTYIGAKISNLLANKVEEKNVRIISGDVLSGVKKAEDSYLNFFDDQVTVIEEGDYYELFGWLLPIAPRPTISNTFPNFLYRDYKFEGDTNMHGEKRAFVVTGQYEKVLPMDIYPQHLMKAILVNDFERMEGLGIYELSEEDVALCEFVCTSKQPLQQILRSGLDTMREQG